MEGFPGDAGDTRAAVLIPGWGGSLEKEMATYSHFLLGELHGQRSLVGCSPRGCTELEVTERVIHFSQLRIDS